MASPEGDISNARDTNMFSFGTPARLREGEDNLNSEGRSVHFQQTPVNMAGSPIEPESMVKTEKKGKSKFIPKSPNMRLIDIKNSTWKTKNQLAANARHLDRKMLYTVGPNEAYVVDRTFDKDMNFLELGAMSHEGEELVKKQPQREYTVTLHSGYDNEHAGSKSKVSPSMRNKLYEDMAKEHEIVVSSPKKYPRKPQ